MAKANILKLLRFDQDIREAVGSGRRLRNCALIQPAGAARLSDSSLCFIGIDAVSASNGTVSASATSLLSLSWDEGLKGELERVNRGSRSGGDANRNQLSETLLQQTIWSTARVAAEQTVRVGVVRAAQIAMLKALDKILAKLAPVPGSIVVLIDEQKTLAQLKYAQMSISNACDRSASVAAASVVAQTFLDALLRQESVRQSSQFDASPESSFAPDTVQPFLKSSLRQMQNQP